MLECHNCKNKFIKRYNNECADCYKDITLLCNNCIYYCDCCNNIYCIKCINKNICAHCKKNYCSWCEESGDYQLCSLCEKNLCGDCGERDMCRLELLTNKINMLEKRVKKLEDKN